MTPIERAARALAGEEHDDIAFDPARDPFWRDRVREVRAVLTAIREPSEAMINAADVDGALDATYPDSEGSFATGGERLAWQAMIDAALAEGE